MRQKISEKREHFWWWPEPLVIPRWTLYIVYGLFTLLGVLLAVDTIPSDDLKTIDSALGPYGLAIAITGMLCFIAAWIPAHPTFEAVFAGVLFALMTTYVASALTDLFAGDFDVAERTTIVGIAVGIPLFRCLTLWKLIIVRWAARG